MPRLDEISYSRDRCIAAFRDYYDFLSKMYLDESAILEPPEGGWPDITTESMKDLGKTDEVIELLRHLPYIHRQYDDEDAQAAPWCYFADWEWSARRLIDGEEADEIRIPSEDPYEVIPPHVFGLTDGGRNNPVFLLDIKLGVVYWPECPGEIQSSASRKRIMDDPYDYAPDDEAEWRGDARAWAIDDFFEVLKDQFRQLYFVPTGPKEVKDVYATLHPNADGMLEMLQKIYREHGWPNIEQYRKQECLEAIHAALRERYPDEVDDD